MSNDPLPAPFVGGASVVLAGPTTNQASSKQGDRIEASGGVVGDIKIENFDIAYGSK